MDSIISLFTDLEEVEHLQFKSDYSDIINEVITAYYDKIMNQLIFEEDDVDDLRSKCLAIREEKPSTLVYEMTDIIMNRFLEIIMKKKVMNTMKKLEFISVAVDTVNCQSIGKMQNLEILRICAKNITSMFLYILPKNLKLFDISDPFILHRNWTTKYTIKPSIIAHKWVNLKILISKAQFLHSLRPLSMLMPSLEIFRIRYSQMARNNPRVRENKLAVRELMIECDNIMADKCAESIHNQEMISFIASLGT